LRIHGLSKRHRFPALRNSTFTPLHDRSQTQRNTIVENFNEFLTSPIGLIAAGVAAFVIGSMFFNVKQWEAHWKQHAIDLSKAMSAWFTRPKSSTHSPPATSPAPSGR
jgi:hypothetical protein